MGSLFCPSVYKNEQTKLNTQVIPLNRTPLVPLSPVLLIYKNK